MLMEGSTVTQGKYRDNIRLAADWLMKRAACRGAIAAGSSATPITPVNRSAICTGMALLSSFLASVYGEEEDKERREKLKDILTRGVIYAGSGSIDARRVVLHFQGRRAR